LLAAELDIPSAEDKCGPLLAVASGCPGVTILAANMRLLCENLLLLRDMNIIAPVTSGQISAVRNRTVKLQ
jgi:hypothetical protein